MGIKRRTDITTLKHLLSVLIRVTNLIFPKSKNVFIRFAILVCRSYVFGKGGFKNSFKCVPVPDRFLKKLASQIDKKSQRSLSFGSCVLLNSKYLQTSIKAHTLVPVHLNKRCRIFQEPCEDLTKRYVEVIATNKLPFQEAVISETFYHNLKNSLKIPCTNDVTISLCCKNENDFILGAQYATKAVVALIHSPNEVHQDLVKHCLTSHFEKPHLLYVGDIFVINISAHMPEAYYVPGYENVNFLHFKVQELEGPTYESISNADKSVGYLVVKQETTLLQTNIQSFIPCSVFNNCQNPEELLLENYKHFLIPNCPPGLNELRNSLISAIQVYLNNAKTYRVSSIKPVFWMIGPSGSGKYFMLSNLALYFGIHLWDFNCDEVFGKLSGQIEGRLRAIFSKARTFTPCILVLSNIQSLCKDAEGHEDLRIISFLNDQLSDETNFPLIVIATSTAEASVPPSLARIFLETFVVPSLTESGRKRQLEWFVRQRGATISDECLDFTASRCSGFLFSDLEALVAHAIRNNTKRVKSRPQTAIRQGVCLTWPDFEEALGKMQSAYSDAIGAPKIPTVTWDDVGGLSAVKEEILRTVNTPLHHPELVAAGLRRSGVLLYGPPGTGKTLIAKAVATECGLNFLSVKGPELLNMYVGQSEENVREVFERARAASPCIIFFDELDSLAPNRGRSGDSGGVMDRVVSQLLAEMDGLQKATHLFVIGATNRPDLIDPGLLRPGRFDKLLYVSACEDAESIACVLRALTRKFDLSNDVDVGRLSKTIPKQVTGADIYAVCSYAWRNAVRRAITSLTSGSEDETLKVQVSEEDFVHAISEMNPSVSAADMSYFKNLEQDLFGNKNYVQSN